MPPVVKFDVPEISGKILSAATIKIYKTYLNKIAQQGYSTVAEVLSNQKAITDFIDAMESKQARYGYYSALFYILHNTDISKKVKIYNEFQKMKDPKHQKLLEEGPDLEKAAAKVVADRVATVEAKTAPKNEVIIAKPKRVIKLKKKPEEIAAFDLKLEPVVEEPKIILKPKQAKSGSDPVTRDEFMEVMKNLIDALKRN